MLWKDKVVWEGLEHRAYAKVSYKTIWPAYEDP